MTEPNTTRVRADFNGLFDELCLSHKDTCEDADVHPATLEAGLVLTVFAEDVDEHGNRDSLIASGTVERSPWQLRCNGSRWALPEAALGFAVCCTGHVLCAKGAQGPDFVEIL